MKESNPAPEPTSTTRSPGCSRRSENGLPTPANDSTARSGSASTASRSYPSRAASGRPVWKWNVRCGSTATSRYLSRTCSRRVTGSTSRGSAIAVASVPGSHGQAGSFPLGKPVDESSGPEALAVELTHGVVRVDAVRAPAVGHDIGILRQRAKLASEFADRERAGAGDVPGRVLGLGPHVENDDLAP